MTHNAEDDMAILKWFMLETDSNIKYTPGKGKGTICLWLTWASMNMLNSSTL